MEDITMHCSMCKIDNIGSHMPPFGGYLCPQDHIQCLECNNSEGGTCGLCGGMTKFLQICTKLNSSGFADPLQKSLAPSPQAKLKAEERSAQRRQPAGKQHPRTAHSGHTNHPRTPWVAVGARKPPDSMKTKQQLRPAHNALANESSSPLVGVGAKKAPVLSADSIKSAQSVHQVPSSNTLATAKSSDSFGPAVLQKPKMERLSAAGKTSKEIEADLLRMGGDLPLVGARALAVSPYFVCTDTRMVSDHSLRGSHSNTTLPAQYAASPRQSISAHSVHGVHSNTSFQAPYSPGNMEYPANYGARLRDSAHSVHCPDLKTSFQSHCAPRLMEYQETKAPPESTTHSVHGSQLDPYFQPQYIAEDMRPPSRATVFSMASTHSNASLVPQHLEAQYRDSRDPHISARPPCLPDYMKRDLEQLPHLSQVQLSLYESNASCRTDIQSPAFSGYGSTCNDFIERCTANFGSKGVGNRSGVNTPAGTQNQEDYLHYSSQGSVCRARVPEDIASNRLCGLHISDSADSLCNLVYQSSTPTSNIDLNCFRTHVSVSSTLLPGTYGPFSDCPHQNTSKSNLIDCNQRITSIAARRRSIDRLYDAQGQRSTTSSHCAGCQEPHAIATPSLPVQPELSNQYGVGQRTPSVKSMTPRQCADYQRLCDFAITNQGSDFKGRYTIPSSEQSVQPVAPNQYSTSQRAPSIRSMTPSQADNCPGTRAIATTSQSLKPILRNQHGACQRAPPIRSMTPSQCAEYPGPCAMATTSPPDHPIMTYHYDECRGAPSIHLSPSDNKRPPGAYYQKTHRIDYQRICQAIPPPPDMLDDYQRVLEATASQLSDCPRPQPMCDNRSSRPTSSIGPGHVEQRQSLTVQVSQRFPQDQNPCCASATKQTPDNQNTRFLSSNPFYDYQNVCPDPSATSQVDEGEKAGGDITGSNQSSDCPRTGYRSLSNGSDCHLEPSSTWTVPMCDCEEEKARSTTLSSQFDESHVMNSSHWDCSPPPSGCMTPWTESQKQLPAPIPKLPSDRHRVSKIPVPIGSQRPRDHFPSQRLTEYHLQAHNASIQAEENIFVERYLERCQIPCNVPTLNYNCTDRDCDFYGGNHMEPVEVPPGAPDRIYTPPPAYLYTSSWRSGMDPAPNLFEMPGAAQNEHLFGDPAPAPRPAPAPFQNALRVAASAADFPQRASRPSHASTATSDTYEESDSASEPNSTPCAATAADQSSALVSCSCLTSQSMNPESGPSPTIPPAPAPSPTRAPGGESAAASAFLPPKQASIPGAESSSSPLVAADLGQRPVQAAAAAATAAPARGQGPVQSVAEAAHKTEADIGQKKLACVSTESHPCLRCSPTPKEGLHLKFKQQILQVMDSTEPPLHPTAVEEVKNLNDNIDARMKKIMETLHESPETPSGSRRQEADISYTDANRRAGIRVKVITDTEEQHLQQRKDNVSEQRILNCYKAAHHPEVVVQRKSAEKSRTRRRRRVKGAVPPAPAQFELLSCPRYLLPRVARSKKCLLTNKPGNSKLLPPLPIQCPDSSCACMVFLCDIHRHLHLDHSQLPMEHISPYQIKDMVLDVRNVCCADNRCHMVFLMRDRIANLGRSSSNNVMPLMVMTSYISSHQMCGQRENTALDGREHLLLWITGIVPMEFPISVVLAVWPRAEPKQCNRSVFSCNMYSIRESQHVCDVYKSGQCLVLSRKELLLMTKGGKTRLCVQMRVH